jgi:hypothetical protein
MTSTTAAPVRSWRPLAWLPFLALLVAIVAMMGWAWVVDSTELEQEAGAWGYLAVAFIAAALYGSLPLLAAFVAGVAASLLRGTRARAVCAVVGAVVAALPGVALVGFAVFVSVADLSGAGGASADLLFCAGLVPIGLVLLVPLLVTVRRWRSDSAPA